MPMINEAKRKRYTTKVAEFMKLIPVMKLGMGQPMGPLATIS
jgi:hypothetical protein